MRNQGNSFRPSGMRVEAASWVGTTSSGLAWSRKSGARAVLTLLALLLAAGGCEVPSAVIEPGAPVPSFQAPGLDGSNLSLASLRGEVVLLNVWATWCYPCRREMPSFEALHREFGDEGLRVVAVSIDSRSARSDIDEFLEDHEITFTILHDAEKRITTTFRTLGVPETFLIDREGRLVKRWTGRIDGHSESVRAPIRAALRE
jgi:cytochrome c biogenesis protein CcmG, thiol:disulfide interchange protein DsbE